MAARGGGGGVGAGWVVAGVADDRGDGAGVLVVMVAKMVRRSLRHHARPCRQASLSSSDSRTAGTARMCASRASAGRAGA